MSKHTPGPWKIYSDHSHDVQIEAESTMIADLYTDDVPEFMDNALLIAAAPELLEALIDVVRIADRKTTEFDAARAAIAKATGESA